MPALDNLALPSLHEALARMASLLNEVALPAATPDSVAVAIAAIPCLLALGWLARRLAGPSRATDIGERWDELHQRLQATELLLADAASEAIQLRQRVDQLASRQDAVTGGNTRNGLRQAIALSRHGATARQLVDTCGLSQGEAHLVQTLYGRAPGQDGPAELH